MSRVSPSTLARRPLLGADPRPLTLACRECGEEFSVGPRGKVPKFCSRECRNADAHRRAHARFLAENFPKTLVCDECGKSWVQERPSERGASRQRFCSDGCGLAFWRREHRLSGKAARWNREYRARKAASKR